MHESLREARDTENLGALLEATEGLGPETIVEILKAIPAQHVLASDAARILASSAEPVEPVTGLTDAFLPSPHPLDYDWRFTKATRKALTERIVHDVGPNGHILALGCPTVCAQLLEGDYIGTITLIDNNPGLPSLSSEPRYLHLQADLLDVSPALCRTTADVVIADPPFYEGHIRGFLLTAALWSHPGTRVLVALPRVGARPTASRDVDATIRWAGTVGLDKVGRDPKAIRYESPGFERRAQAARGIHGVPYDWRTADLFHFQRNTDEVPTVAANVIADRERWVETRIGSVRWRVRVADPQSELTTASFENDRRLLRPLVDGDVLDSVSNRDPRRELANVWTDGNVIWHTDDPALLLTVLAAIANDDDPIEAASDYCNTAGTPFILDDAQRTIARVRAEGMRN